MQGNTESSILAVSSRVAKETDMELRIGFYLPNAMLKHEDESGESMVAYGVYDSYEKDAKCDVHIYGIPRAKLMELLGVDKSSLYRYLRGEAQRLFAKCRVNHIDKGVKESE